MTNDSRGLTITELMISIALLGMVIAAAASFFIYQSGYGRTASVQKRARENINLAMTILRSDIQHAGFGVNDKPRLALFLRDLDGDVYKELYVNYGTFLETSTASSFNVFDEFAYFDGNGSTTVSLSDWSHITFHEQEASFLMVDSGPPTVDPIGLTSLTAGTVTADSNMLTGVAHAPAIQYRYDPAQKALLRNDDILIGGEPYYSVEDFRIRARFFANSSDFWSPSSTDSTLNFDMQDVENLRELEITTAYKMKMSDQTSLDDSQTYEKTIRVAPRALVLQQQQ